MARMRRGKTGHTAHPKGKRKSMGRKAARKKSRYPLEIPAIPDDEIDRMAAGRSKAQWKRMKGTKAYKRKKGQRGRK